MSKINNEKNRGELARKCFTAIVASSNCFANDERALDNWKVLGTDRRCWADHSSAGTSRQQLGKDRNLTRRLNI